MNAISKEYFEELRKKIMQNAVYLVSRRYPDANLQIILTPDKNGEK